MDLKTLLHGIGARSLSVWHKKGDDIQVERISPPQDALPRREFVSVKKESPDGN